MRSARGSLTHPLQLAGLAEETPIRVTGQTTTLGLDGPFLRRMVQAGVKVEVAHG